MAKKTKVGKSISAYVKDTLAESQKAQEAALAAGYPKESTYTQAYYAGVPYLYMYGDEAQREALARSGDLYGQYGAAKGYDKTGYGDIEAAYGAAGQYDPAQYGEADYTTRNIQERMSPYEELVSRQAEKRLKRGYDEAAAERQAQALRAGAFGGSGAAIQEEVARRNYLEQAADMNAQNLQAGYEAAVALYGKEFADNMAAQQAEEASRQFGKNTEMAGLEGIMSARNQTAAQVAAAKEAELAGLQGQANSVAQQAALAEQQKNMQITNLNAMNQAGQQKEKDQYDRSLYPLTVSTIGANILAPVSGAASPLPTQKEQKPSGLQQAIGIGTAALGAATGLFGKRDGGLIERYAAGGLAQGLDLYRAGAMIHHYMNGGLASIPNDMYNMRYNGGGLADLEPEYYSHYES